ncbi:DctP family TRAP transporter solute-binding subunit [Aminiphilus sp.]|jgi:C4-dicarboxylate-binding protein DctP|uniref:TRAP transporter substrate-binding protein n=1 Tax=Aminiphilus sp. TaxID=1872488 RepID=UPI002624D3B9|nr:DctP family TRAP transporter solute-binding subunit [Aminiphilus sp.]
MVKIGGRRALVVVAAVSMCVFLAGGALAATEFRLSNQFPASHHVSKGLVFFAEKVAELSKGEMKANVFDSAQLFKDTEVVEAVQEGLVEVALVPVNKWSGMIPAADVFEMPFVFSDLTSPKKFLDAGAGTLLDEEFQKMGAKVVFWVDYGLVQFFNSKRTLRVPDDFKGLKIRTFSSGTADTVTALGGTPVVISSSEMYMALQRGTVDGATTGMPAAVSRKIFEVQKYMTMANYTTAQFVVQANLKWWNALSDEQRDVLLKAGDEAAAWIRDAIADSELEAEKTIRDAGVEVTTLTPEERELFVKATEPVRTDFANKTGELGKKLIEMALAVE